MGKINIILPEHQYGIFDTIFWYFVGKKVISVSKASKYLHLNSSELTLSKNSHRVCSAYFKNERTTIGNVSTKGIHKARSCHTQFDKCVTSVVIYIQVCRVAG